MSSRKYQLWKTAKKTATVNNLVLSDNNGISKYKILFDFSLLDSLDIPNEENTAIKNRSVRYCSVANRTEFIIFNLDNFSLCDATVDFAAYKVYDSLTGQLLYVIMELVHIRYCHAERNSIYDDYYRENINQFEIGKCTDSVICDLEY